MNSIESEEIITVIKPSSGWKLLNLKEIVQYRDLFYFLILRDIKALYAQTILGFGWAIFQPLVQIIVFTIIFGRIAEVSSEGIPYALYSTIAIVPWTYLSTATTKSSQSLVSNQGMLGKVYFPRFIFPIAPVLATFVDFMISLVLVIAALMYYKVTPTWNILLFPVFTLMMIAFSAGIGMWLSSLAIRFRDVRFAMPFVIKMLIYSAPIVYSAEKIPEAYRILYSVNPIVGIIEGIRASLIGTAMPWPFIVPGMIMTVLILVSGAFYFKRMERIFVDVI
jgi:lipopolysaccharide transport system permease protein